jgi:hypothetical protein
MANVLDALSDTRSGGKSKWAAVRRSWRETP